MIEKIRSERGIRQTDLAAKAQIRQSTLSDLENLKADVMLGTLEKVAAALNMTVGEIYCELDQSLKEKHQPISSLPTGSLICQHHAALLHRLDLLLDQPNGDRWVPIIEALLTSATREPGSGNPSSERQHGPVDTTRLPIPGVSNIEFKKPDARRKRN